MFPILKFKPFLVKKIESLMFSIQKFPSLFKLIQIDKKPKNIKDHLEVEEEESTINPPRC